MNKSKLLAVASLVMAISFQSCKDNTPPSNPTNGQVYKDDKNNTWTWNETMGCWMIMSAINNMNNGGGSHYHYYYPSSNRWTDSRGYTTTAPAYVPKTTTESLTNKFTEKSYKANSSTSSSNSSKSSVSTKSSDSKKSSGLNLFKSSSSSSSKSSGTKSGGFGSSSKSSFSS